MANDCTENPWDALKVAAFVRENLFDGRLRDVRELLQALSDFSRLAKIEVGGTKVPS